MNILKIGHNYINVDHYARFETEIHGSDVPHGDTDNREIRIYWHRADAARDVEYKRYGGLSQTDFLDAIRQLNNMTPERT